jgi:hypothetical protein
MPFFTARSKGVVKKSFYFFAQCSKFDQMALSEREPFALLLLNINTKKMLGFDRGSPIKVS